MISLRSTVFPALVFVFAAVACGPSFQVVYESDVRFEHCYALDEGSVSPDAKQECWRRWLHSYTYGQSRDRVEYAATRLSQLSLGPTLPSEEGRVVRPPKHTATVAAPVPTNAFAPPPNLAASSTADDAGAPPVRDALRVPGAECSEACKQRWTTCRDGCKDNERACYECDRRFRACVPPCFRDEQAAPRPPPPPVRVR